MGHSWTFGQKLALGLTAKAAVTLMLALVAVLALRYVVAAKDEVLAKNLPILTDSQNLETIALERMGTVRAYLLTGNESYKETIHSLWQQYFDLLKEISHRVNTPEEKQALDRLGNDAKTQFDSGDSVVAMRHKEADMPEVGKAFQERVVPLNQLLRKDLAAFVAMEEANLDGAREQASQSANRAIVAVILFAAASVAGGVLLVIMLSRILSRQVGSAVQHIQNSSSELQAAANQQTAVSKEQVASMTEISTTIKQLMSTAKQIADSAQGVAHIADNTTSAARGGDQTVLRAQSEIAAIRRQVDLVVEHMLALGKKSQQIGGILEIINELAEQTNILAINATIEAAGAGESGKRFSVVADEIRKLADRVGGSTKEIRALIEQIHAAVNAAVMATESGSKAVDTGTRQFNEVTAVFGKISDLLRNTSEAAREIELSTKQQSTAVEQVNVAVANVAQSARESEASSNQVLQTVGELTSLSRNLGRLIHSENHRMI